MTSAIAAYSLANKNYLCWVSARWCPRDDGKPAVHLRVPTRITRWVDRPALCVECWQQRGVAPSAGTVV